MGSSNGSDKSSVAPPKSKYGRRRLRLSPGLGRALWVLQGKSKPESDDLVFTADRGARIDASNLMSRVLKPAAVAAGMGEWVIDPKARGGRRAESWVGLSLVPPYVRLDAVSEWLERYSGTTLLGHHKPSFTLDTYIHFLQADVRSPHSLMRLAVHSSGPPRLLDTRWHERPSVNRRQCEGEHLSYVRRASRVEPRQIDIPAARCGGRVLSLPPLQSFACVRRERPSSAGRGSRHPDRKRYAR